MPAQNLFQLPSTVPYADKINPIIASAQRLPWEEHYLEDVTAFPSDQSVGVKITNTDLLWEDATTTQQEINNAIATAVSRGEAKQTGGTFPDNMQEIMDANAGPRGVIWNESYRYLGLVPGSAAQFKTLDTVVVSTAQRVTVILP